MTVTVLWVFFRAENIDSAISIFKSLLAIHTPPDPDFNNIKISDGLWFLLLITWFAPNTKEIMFEYSEENKKLDALQPSSESKKRWYHWYPNQWWAALAAILFVISILELTNSKGFIYFQF